MNIIKETETARFVPYYDWALIQEVGKDPIDQWNGKRLIAVSSEDQIQSWPQYLDTHGKD